MTKTGTFEVGLINREGFSLYFKKKESYECRKDDFIKLVDETLKPLEGICNITIRYHGNEYKVYGNVIFDSLINFKPKLDTTSIDYLYTTVLKYLKSNGWVSK